MSEPSKPETDAGDMHLLVGELRAMLAMPTGG